MEHYKGIKFAVRFAEKKLLDFPIQKELIAWGEKLSKLDCIPTYPHPENPHIISSAGNLSARIDGKFIVTSAGSNLGVLTQKNFVEIIDVDVHTETIQAIGIEQPSSETMLHNEIYKKREDILVILHGHNDLILQYAQELGLKSTRNHYPYGTIKLTESVTEILKDDDEFLIMKGHGFLSFGKTCQQAGENIIRVLNKITKISGA